MSSCEGRFVKIGVVFDALYFGNEVSDPPIFFHSDVGNSLSDCSQSMKKICIVEVFRANDLKLSQRLDCGVACIYFHS